MASIRCGHCKGRHESVREVHECATSGPPPIPDEPEYGAFKRPEEDPLEYPASTPHSRYAQDFDRHDGAFCGVCHAGGEHPEPEPKTLAEEPSEGIFVDGNDVYYKVQQNLAGTAFYAKVWVDGPSGTGSGAWDYVGRSPLYRLTEENRVTAEQAAHFGAVTGTCVFCGRKLTDERSISVGYGPVCAEHNGLPWGEAA